MALQFDGMMWHFFLKPQCLHLVSIYVSMFSDQPELPGLIHDAKAMYGNPSNLIIDFIMIFIHLKLLF